MVKKMKKRLTTLLLALALAAQLISCGGENSDTPETSGDQSSETTSEAASDELTDSLPKDLRFDGEKINILYRGREDIADYDLIGQENSGDIVYDAVYERNLAVMERFGIEFEFTAAPKSIGDAMAYFKTAVLSGADGIDLIWATGNTLVVSGLNGAFRDFSESEYLDFEKPWWNLPAMREISLDGQTINYLYGNLMLIGLRQTGLMYFNKNIYTDLYGDPDKLYETVLDGNWTLDEFARLCKGVYQDLNGNSKADEDDDRFAAVFSSSIEENLTHFVYSTDFTTYKRGTDNLPVIDMTGDRSVTIATRFCELFKASDPDYSFSTHPFSETKLYENFAAGHYLFFPERFYAATLPTLRDMKDEYGMIPYPKFDENQKEYRNLIHNSGTVAAAPIALSDERFEMVCAVLEAMAAKQQTTVLPTFYEVALKTKYSRDDLSSQVIDLVYSCSTKDLVSEYGSMTKYIYAIVAKCVQKGLPFASTYASEITAANAELQKLCDDVIGK